MNRPYVKGNTFKYFLSIFVCLVLLSTTVLAQETGSSTGEIVMQVQHDDGHMEIIKLNPDGSNTPFYQIDGVSVDNLLGISPDGGKLVFFGSVNTEYGYYVGTLNGATPVKLPFDPYDDVVNDVAFSPNGQQITGANGHQIFVIDLNNPGQLINVSEKLSLGDFPSFTTPLAFSPDGTSVAFFELTAPGLYVANVSNPDSITSNSFNLEANGTPYEPVYSPDGQSILFTLVNTDSQSSLMMVNLSDSSTTNLTDPATDGIFQDAIYLPSGQIALSAGGNLSIMNADGTGKQVVAQESFNQMILSPDGKQILFSRDKWSTDTSEGEGPQAETTWYIINVDGTGERAITLPENVTGVPHTYWVGQSENTAPASTSGLTQSQLAGTAWAFSREDGTLLVEKLVLEADGSITPIATNENSWGVEDGVLVIYTDQGIPSTRFTDVTTENGVMVLKGAFLLEPSWNITHVLSQQTP